MPVSYWYENLAGTATGFSKNISSYNTQCTIGGQIQILQFGWDCFNSLQWVSHEGHNLNFWSEIPLKGIWKMFFQGTPKWGLPFLTCFKKCIFPRHAKLFNGEDCAKLLFMDSCIPKNNLLEQWLPVLSFKNGTKLFFSTWGQNSIILSRMAYNFFWHSVDNSLYSTW